jgi:flagellar motility protein MotE (MotC chaperone)
MAHIPTPRLLPLTIFAMGGLLAMKSVTLVRAAVSGADTGAVAAAPAAAPAHSSPSTAADNPGATATVTQGSPGQGMATRGMATQGVTTQGVTTKGPTPQGATTQGTTTQVATAQAAAGPAPVMPSMPDPPAPAVGAGERTVLLELRRRRDELDARETMVAAREATLSAAELRLGARVGELQTLQKKLEDLEQAREQRDDASWQGLVKLYETMKPRDAAAIFNDLDMPVLLSVVDRMKDAKAATVLAAMQPDKAREVTTKLATLRTKRAAVAQGN